jgi:endonuclease G
MQEDGKSMSQSFFMSNMAPQYPKHNRGIWRGLEVLVRNWTVKQERNLYVITGTAYIRAPICLPNAQPCVGGDVRIPDAFYKVIIDKDKQDAVAFLIPNQEGGFAKLIDYRIRLADLAKVINIDLIPGADAAMKQKLLTADGSTFPKKVP